MPSPSATNPAKRNSATYETEPCFEDCWGDGLPNAHYHEVTPTGARGEDMIRKIDEQGNPKVAQELT